MVNGSAYINISGGTLSGAIYGGGSTYSVLTGDANITISGGVINSSIYGGGDNNVIVNGNKNLTFDTTGVYTLGSSQVGDFTHVYFNGGRVDFGGDANFTNTNISVSNINWSEITETTSFVIANFAGNATYSGASFSIAGNIADANRIFIYNGTKYRVNANADQLNVGLAIEPPSMHVTIKDDIVDNSDDQYSLREALVNYAVADGTVTFDSSLNSIPIVIDKGWIRPDKNITIQGNGTANTIINGGLVFPETSHQNHNIIGIDKDIVLTVKDICINAPIILMAGATLATDGVTILNYVLPHPGTEPDINSRIMTLKNIATGKLTINSRIIGDHTVALQNTKEAKLLLENLGSMTITGAIEATTTANQGIEIINSGTMEIQSTSSSSIDNNFSCAALMKIDIYTAASTGLRKKKQPITTGGYANALFFYSIHRRSCGLLFTIRKQHYDDAKN